MSTFSANRDLILFESSDKVNFEQLNANTRTIDEDLHNALIEHVVKTETNNGWYCRYWSSGMLECYKTEVFDDVNLTTAYASDDYYDKAQNPSTMSFPEALVSIPTINVTMEPMGTTNSKGVFTEDTSLVLSASIYSVSTTSFGLRILSTNSKSKVKARAHMRVFGRYE